MKVNRDDRLYYELWDTNDIEIQSRIITFNKDLKYLEFSDT